MIFMKQLLSGKKKYFHTFEVRKINIPRYRGCSVEVVYEKA